MRSLILTLDPAMGGGVGTMQRVMRLAHRRLGLDVTLGFARHDRRSRWHPGVRSGQFEGHPTLSSGYWPSVEYLNYLVPALAMRAQIRQFPIIQVVSGMHSNSLMPILAGVPFVSWVATPFLDEVASRRQGPIPTLSVRLNHGLRAVNQRLERWSLRFPSLVLALSEYTARRLQVLTGLSRNRLEILRCPVDHQLFRPDGPRWPAAPGRYLISVGRVDDDRKNYAALVRAFGPVAARFPDLHLVIVGPAERADNAVVALARSAGLGERIHFPGPLGGEALAAVYRGAEAYVMTSRQEGLGIVVIEAQAAGLPVIIMRCGGSDELVSDGDDGRLIDQGDEAGFARVLGDALTTPVWLSAAGAAARQKVLAHSTYEVFTERVRAVYRRVFPVAGAELAA
ncbi:MAG TPA: glycosyltransferase family 4 protein [Polyangia bacterium]|jgi:glycosyltransferase involved in cell wall biosynthesis|nr:glycosyltransferase family 4 protein [Polyangia bacterium]